MEGCIDVTVRLKTLLMTKRINRSSIAFFLFKLLFYFLVYILEKLAKSAISANTPSATLFD